ncbi:MAG: hypothetical protein HGN29_13845 [Asgard group archaeon]|nr:hypothetical protein [Asgard group archaeon]
MSTEEPKQSKQLKAGVKLKTKPAVVPKKRKMKTKGDMLPIAALVPRGISKWNIIFTVLFSGLLAATIVNSYFKEFLVIPLPNFILKIIVPIIIGIEVFLILIAFETYKVKFTPNILRVIITIITILVLFPITLFKYHTRHSVKRIVFTGLILWSLVFSFFSPYFGMIGKIRDLEDGIAEQNVDQSWFENLFQGSAPFYIDGLLDLLDSLDLNDTLANQEMAQVRAETGSLGNYLYRWEINDYYNPTTWEFEGNNAQRFTLEPTDYGQPGAASITDLNITETIYSTTSLYSQAIDANLLTTWSSYFDPHLYDVTPTYSWDDFLRDENGTASAEAGSTNIRFNSRDQLTLESIANAIGFLGTYNYKTYFALDSEADKQAIKDNSLSFTDLVVNDSTFQTDFSNFLQKPSGYETLSPNVHRNSLDWAIAGVNNGFTIYEQITYILDQILIAGGFPTSADSDNQGQDRAERFWAVDDRSFTAFLAATVMALRWNNIPARPVFGFAIGEDIGGVPNHRSLTLSHLYGWIEAIIPVGAGNYRWGQFQIGPYPSGGDLIYCENTLYSSYNVSVEFLSVIPQDPGIGEEVYVIDNYVDYTLRATVTSEGSPVVGASVQFETISTADYQAAQSNPTELLSLTRGLGSDVTDGFGYAAITYDFDHVNYTVLNFADQEATSYILIAYISLASIGGAGFVVIPEGYLSALAMNTSKQVLPNPQNITEYYDYYIVQKGRSYQISTILYEDVAHTTVLTDRVVSYYVLTQDDLTELLFGILDPQILLDNKIGVAFTDWQGNSTLQTNDTFDSLLTGTTYFLAASYGANYTYSVMLIVQAEKSTIDINSTDLDNFELDIYLYTEPLGGSADKLANEPLEVWIAPESDYSSFVGTEPDDLKSHLLAANSTGPFCQIVTLPGATTDSNGFYNDTFTVSSSNYGTGFFVVIVFYLSTWNTTSAFLIGSGPVWLVDPISPNFGVSIFDASVMVNNYSSISNFDVVAVTLVVHLDSSISIKIVEVEEWH